MRLSDLALPGAEIRGEAEITSVCIDSRSAGPGCLFVCLPGSKHDAHAFVGDAAVRGAAAVVCTDKAVFSGLGLPGVLVEDAVAACWMASKQVYGDPSSKMKVVGITGTNGKTTVAWILKLLLENLGARAGYMGTLGVRLGAEALPTDLTTPFSPQINATLALAVEKNMDFMAMEVSSHALAQRRTAGIDFAVGVFTNLTQDHLDYHKDIESYFASKSLLFQQAKFAVANADDPYGQRILQNAPRKIGFGTSGDLRLLDSKVELSSLSFEFEYLGNKYSANAPLGARFNVANCLAAIGAAIALGFDPGQAAIALKSVRPAPGRFEPVDTGGEYTVLVDYAHTPDAIEQLLKSVAELPHRRILTVFGCGGDRDRAKRPKMAAAASALSDQVFVTSDNPRTQDPNDIIAEILPGLLPNAAARVEPDRRKAIQAAIAEARAGDVVVIAGKGHEDYQILGTEKIHFDDRLVAREAIAEKSACV